MTKEDMSMTPKQFSDKMKKIANTDDIERAHVDADQLMCELLTQLGYKGGVKVFRGMSKWYA